MTQAYEKAMGQAMTYLGFKARTARQMEQYLQKKQHDEHTIACVMEKLTEYGLVDDEQYAQRYVETHKGADGKFLLRQKLARQGLDRDCIDEALGGVTFDQQVEAARALLEKKLRSDSREDALRRAMQAALRRGFPYDAVRAAASAYKEDFAWDE